MGDIINVNISFTKENHRIASDVKNGETWPDFFMRLVRDEKKRRDIILQPSQE